MAVIKVGFLIPLKEDGEIGNGTLHPPFRWRLLQDVIYNQFFGWTRSDKRTGVWKSPKTGLPVQDVSRAFEVDVDEARIDEIRTVLRSACLTFVQQSIRVVIRGEVEYLEAGPTDQPLECFGRDTDER